MHSYRPIFCMTCGSHAPTVHATGCPHGYTNVGRAQGLHGSLIVPGPSSANEAFQHSSRIWPASNVNPSSTIDVTSIAGRPALGAARVHDDLRQVGVGNGDTWNHDVPSAHVRLATAVGVDASKTPLSPTLQPESLPGQDQATDPSTNEPDSSFQMAESAIVQMRRGIQYLEPLLGPDDSQIAPHWSSQPTLGTFESFSCSANELSAANAPESAVVTSTNAGLPPSHVQNSGQPSLISYPAQGMTLPSGNALPVQNHFTSDGTSTGQDGADAFAGVELSDLDFSFLDGFDWDDLSSTEVQAAEEIDFGFNNL